MKSGTSFDVVEPECFSESGEQVEVEAPARLHLGFLDLNGGLGRRYGSIGLTIDSMATRLRARKATTFAADGPGADRALSFARKFAARKGIAGGVHLHMKEIIPDHAGLGSGTQMALAVGTAMGRLYGIPAECRDIAETLGRGARSGIGIGAFEQGGFLLDCGRGESEGAPPVAVRLPFPEQWRILLLFDHRQQGLHGSSEQKAFAALPDFTEASAGHLCRLVMMKLLPGLMESSLQGVGEAIGEIQRVVGDHFAPAQGGRFTSPRIAEALEWIRGQGLSGIGQSSWGPTGFVFLQDQAQGRQLQKELEARYGKLMTIRSRLVAGRNRGAEIKVTSIRARLAKGNRRS